MAQTFSLKELHETIHRISMLNQDNKSYTSLQISISQHKDYNPTFELSCYIANTPIVHTTYKSDVDLLNAVRDNFLTANLKPKIEDIDIKF